MTGELRHWQSDGWLEAQHAEQLLREQRATRRDEVHVLLADLRHGVAVLGRHGAVALRRLSLLRRPG